MDIKPAEVIQVIYNNNNPELLYGIKFKFVGSITPTRQEGIVAIPLNINNIRIPLVGEIVLICNTISPESSYFNIKNTYYYIDIISLNNSISNNSLPMLSSYDINTSKDSSSEYQKNQQGVTNKQDQPKVDENFNENTVQKPLQIFAGDALLQGRNGQSIRFGTQPKNKSIYSATPNYYDSSDLKCPITIIRNTFTNNNKTGKINDFEVENFTEDDNIICLASSQKLKFTQVETPLDIIKKNNLISWQEEKWGVTPQILISSGRVICNATKQEIMLFAKKGIGLTSNGSISIEGKDNITINANKIELGMTANEAMVFGNQLITWLQQFITILGTITPIAPNGVCSPLTTTPQWASILNMQTKLQQLISKKCFLS
jgi:hypothetical protein